MTDDPYDTVVNISSDPVRFEIGTGPGEPPRKYRLMPGETAELERSYARPRRGTDGSPQYCTEGQPPPPPQGFLPSVIEGLTGGRVVWVGDERAKEARKA